MPERETVERAQRDAREGKSPSTQAGEFVREEMHHVPRRKTWCEFAAAGDCHRPIQGQSLRREPGSAEGPASLRKKAEQDSAAGKHPSRKVSQTRPKAVSAVLKRKFKVGRQSSGGLATCKKERGKTPGTCSQRRGIESCSHSKSSKFSLLSSQLEIEQLWLRIEY